MKITIYPNSIFNSQPRINPYIEDFKNALSAIEGIEIINKPHKNPLISLLKSNYQGDVFIFNWLENVPDYKYGIMQFFAAIYLLFSLKLKRKKIVWILHNKEPHSGNSFFKRTLMRLGINKADIIITHAKEGIEVIKNKFPNNVSKVYFLDHPTKDRLGYLKPVALKYDWLIWGNINRYKGVVEFLKCLRQNGVKDLKGCIVGKCSSQELLEELQESLSSNINFFNVSASFEELGEYISASRFVLIPYHSETIISSGILMDSLSFGVRVIGPDAGSFKDYKENGYINVYTFKSVTDIPFIIKTYREKNKINLEKYAIFLEQNNWSNFSRKLIELIN